MVTRTVPEAPGSGVVDVFSTGGFLVPDSPEPLILHLYFSNPSYVEGSITFRIDHLTRTAKRRVVAGKAVVPARGVALVELDLTALHLGGKKVEVTATLPLLPVPEFQAIHPSLGILAVGEGGATRPVIFLSTGDFNAVAERTGSSAADASRPVIDLPGPGGIPAFPNEVTWGVFDVPVSPAEAQTDVRINFTNVSAQPETAVLRVFAVMQGTTTTVQILRSFVTVPANGAEAVILVDLDKEGIGAIEVVVEQPFASPPAPYRLPLLTPSVDVVRVADTQLTDTLLYLAPGKLRF